MTKLLLTIPEAAEALALSKSKVYELVGTREIQSVTIGRSRRVSVEALHAFIVSREQ